MPDTATEDGEGVVPASPLPCCWKMKVHCLSIRLLLGDSGSKFSVVSSQSIDKRVTFVSLAASFQYLENRI